MRSRTSGSALLLALWALLLLSAAVFAWVKFIHQDIARAGDANAGLEAKAFAHSGVQVALHPLVTRETPLLENEIAPERGYKAKIIGEAGKLNLNWLLQGSASLPPGREAAERLAIFNRYLDLRGLSFHEREVLVDCLLDWLDPDNIHRLNGVEDEGDYHAANRGKFLSVDEIAQVKGSKPLVDHAGWRDDFTIFTTGKIDLTAAPLEVLQVLPNVGEARAQRFIETRQGPDKIDFTADDRVFKDVPEALSYLGLTGPAAQAVTPFVTLKDPTVRIVSEGQSGKVYRQVEVVAQKGSGQPRIIWWKE